MKHLRHRPIPPAPGSHPCTRACASRPKESCFTQQSQKGGKIQLLSQTAISLATLLRWQEKVAWALVLRDARKYVTQTSSSVQFVLPERFNQESRRASETCARRRKDFVTMFNRSCGGSFESCLLPCGMCIEFCELCLLQFCIRMEFYDCIRCP